MTKNDQSPSKTPFVHPSEAQFARLLDFYQIPWEYEPRTFVLKQDKDGRVVEAFSPDFYLPDQDLYIELTTMKQSLITKKHGKLRRLRKRYPQINIKLLNRSDFQQMVHKYDLDEADVFISPPVDGQPD
jgi:hypoxanthine phosphoribosyltransferase